MPATHSLKTYLPHATYHIYNRGAFKETIFRDDNDYECFYRLLYQTQRDVGVRINVEALLPNHLHLQIFQTSERGIQHFMKSVGVRYSFYFRKKYQHSGRIFQGCYKAALLQGQKRIQENTLYILENPTAAHLTKWKYVGRFTAWRENFL